MPTLDDIRKKRADILRIAAKHGARDVRVFGSVVRGESTDGSDLDLLVKMDKGRTLLDRIALIQDLEDLLRCNVDVVNERALNPLLRERVLSEGVPL